MKHFCFFLMILFIGSCQQQNSGTERRRIGNKFVETKFIDDTTYQGLTKYYSLSKVLESEIEFKNGIKNGYSKNYYPNGSIHDSVTFLNGLAHGYHFVYDSVGNLEYKDFFFQGRKVGGLFYYNRGKISEYDFVSFDEEPLYKAKYDNRESVKEFGGQIINLHTSTRLVDNRREDVLFLYMLNPPNVSIKYSVGIFDSAQQSKENFKIIPQSQNMFVEINVPKVRNKASYFVQADYIDTANKFFNVYITPFDF